MKTHSLPQVRLHPEGYSIVAAAAAAAAISVAIGAIGLTMAVLLTAACALFFRDVDRVVPEGETLIVSPADGVVAIVEESPPPAELALGDDPMLRVSIFMSVLDGHVNRAPIGGVITRIVYSPGRFFNASLDKFSKLNERNGLVIRAENGAVAGMVQIAGLIARRIVCHPSEGDSVLVGERVGMIRFGSRVDVYFDPACAVMVCPGQRVVGGETTLADLAAPVARRTGVKR